MDGFGIQQDRVFTQVKDSQEYLLFPPDFDPYLKIVIVILARPGTGPFESLLPVQPPLRSLGGIGRVISTFDNGYQVAVVVVVVSVVIVVFPVPEVDIGRHLREAEGYLHVDHWPRILVLVVLSHHTPSAAIMIVFRDVPPPTPSGRRKRKRKGRRRAWKERHHTPWSPVRDRERLP